MAASDVLRMMIKGNMGPYTDYSPETARNARRELDSVCDYILTDVLGDELSPVGGYVGTEYDRDGDRLLIMVTFFGKAPMTAQEIATMFLDRVEIPLKVEVVECTSEWHST